MQPLQTRARLPHADMCQAPPPPHATHSDFEDKPPHTYIFPTADGRVVGVKRPELAQETLPQTGVLNAVGKRGVSGH